MSGRRTSHQTRKAKAARRARVREQHQRMLEKDAHCTCAGACVGPNRSLAAFAGLAWIGCRSQRKPHALRPTRTRRHTRPSCRAGSETKGYGHREPFHVCSRSRSDGAERLPPGRRRPGLPGLLSRDRSSPAFRAGRTSRSVWIRGLRVGSLARRADTRCRPPRRGRRAAGRAWTHSRHDQTRRGAPDRVHDHLPRGGSVTRRDHHGRRGT